MNVEEAIQMAKSRGQRKIHTGLAILKSVQPRRFRHFGARLECARLLSEIAAYAHLPFAASAAKRYHRLLKGWIANTYADVIEAWRTPPKAAAASNPSPRIWTFWSHGLADAPEIVKRCATSMERNRGGAELIHVDLENLHQYLQLDGETLRKVAAGKISLTELSNYVRLSLLYAYGGLWLDANIWVNRPIDPDVFSEAFYSIRNPENPIDHNIAEGRWATFLLAAPAGSPVMGFARDMYLSYFHREDMLVDYFVFDAILAVGYDSFPWFRALVDAAPETPDFRPFRLHRILEGGSGDALRAALEDSAQPFYKLTHKAKYSQYPEALG